MVYIYPESQPDYYSFSWNKDDFREQCKILSDSKTYLATAENGFRSLNLIEKIIEIVKGILGYTDQTAPHRVEFAILKFLYYGEAQGYFEKDKLDQLEGRISIFSTDETTISQLFQEIRQYYFCNEHPDHESRSEHLKNIRQIVVDYHQKHTKLLQPGFWHCYFHLPSVQVKDVFDFGDTPLQLMDNALQGENPNPHLALSCLQKAFQLENDDEEFQKKLELRLNDLGSRYSSALKNQSHLLQELWVELAKASYGNKESVKARCYLERALQINGSDLNIRLKVGKLYLINKDYDLAQPFLPHLQKAYSQNPNLLREIGDAYLQEKKFTQALDAYESAIRCYNKTLNGRSNHKEQIASLNEKIGMIYLENLSEREDHLTKALEFFTRAVQNSLSVQYRDTLYLAYVQLWKKDPTSFAASYSENFLQFLKNESRFVERWEHSALEILTACAEHYFRQHQNSKAHLYISKTFPLFQENAELRVMMLDLSIRYQDWAPLKSYFHDWLKKYYAHPYIKVKIGDAYWNTVDQNLAVQLYQDALTFLEQRLSTCQTAEERTKYSDCIATLRAKVAQHQLQIKQPPYTEALQNLEKAASLNPALYNSPLFDAYIAAAQKEQGRNWAQRDNKKILFYYEKAFQVDYRNGPYLNELIRIYLDQNNFSKLLELYYIIQEQPWAKECVFPAKVWSKLGELLVKKKDYASALKCYQNAYKMEASNHKYKKDYFEAALLFAKENLSKFSLDQIKDNDIPRMLELIQPLENCWKEGFKQVEDFQALFQEILGNLYGIIANSYMQQCLLPRPKTEFSPLEIRKHQTAHQVKISEALKFYDLGLKYAPENACLYFDKGVLLEWTLNHEQALVAYTLAVRYEPRNPFYHKLLGSLSFVVHSNGDKQNEHNELAEEYGPPDFMSDYLLWSEEHVSKTRTKMINPHDYTKKKTSWF